MASGNEWTNDAPFIPKRPSFPRPQRAFNLSPLNRIVVIMEAWLLSIAVMTCFAAYADEPALTWVPLGASPSSAFIQGIPFFLIVPPAGVLLFSIRAGAKRGWFTFLYRRYVIVKHYALRGLYALGRGCVCLGNGLLAFGRLCWTGVALFAKGVWMVLGGILKLIGMCVGACFGCVYAVIGHTRPYRRWKRRIRRFYRWCASLCCRCLPAGKKAKSALVFPDNSDSGESSDGMLPPAQETARSRKESAGTQNSSDVGTFRPMTSLLDGEGDDGLVTALPLMKPLALGLKDGKATPTKSARRRARTASSGPRHATFSTELVQAQYDVDAPVSRGRTHSKLAFVDEEGEDLDLENGYAGAGKEEEGKALVASPSSPRPVIDVWSPPPEEGLRVTLKQQSKGKLKPLVEIPPGMLDPTEAVFFSSYECMSELVARGYASAQESAARRKPNLCQR